LLCKPQKNCKARAYVFDLVCAISVIAKTISKYYGQLIAAKSFMVMVYCFMWLS